MAATPTLSALPDNPALALYDWPLPPGSARRGTLLLVHGLGEHAGRYAELARSLNGAGWGVRSYDQVGHGRSPGPRGVLARDAQLLDDLARVIDVTRAAMPAGAPLVLLGHSLGGLVAARAVSLGLRPVQGLVLSSPALDAGLNAVQKALIAVLYRLAPTLAVGNGLSPRYLSHDTAVVRAYQDDPLVHDRISARLARFIAHAGPAVLAEAPRWPVPTLLLYAGQDRLVAPAGSRALAAAAPPQQLTARCFDGLYHEIFNELERAQVTDALLDWLRLRWPAF
ncbi:MAG: alpha/beta hydrolase [Proteobacteria bacterium]|jgi:alpha-beta hydrolase superfamily lysophospholipase|nr:alpha/beta hydrolase [Pseudomonadota bacterium]